MPDPMRIRATEQPDGVDVRVLMSHEMETGQRRDSAGAIVPAHFIQTVVVSYNGKPVLNAEWGPAVAKKKSASPGSTTRVRLAPTRRRSAE